MNREELLEECFGPGREPRGDLYYEEQEERPDEGARAVVAHAGVRYRRIVVGNTTVWIAAISNVCVDPDRRGEGRAKRLLEEIHRSVETHPAVAFAAAFADDGRLLEALGYEKNEHVDGLYVRRLGNEQLPPGRPVVDDPW